MGSAINMLLTMKGEWNQLQSNTLIKFMVLASTFYMLTTIEGPIQSLNQLMLLHTLQTGFQVTFMMEF